MTRSGSYCHVTTDSTFNIFPFSPATVDASTHQDQRIQKNPVWGLLPAGKVTCSHTELSDDWEDVFLYSDHCLVCYLEDVSHLLLPLAEVMLSYTFLVEFKNCNNLLHIILYMLYINTFGPLSCMHHFSFSHLLCVKKCCVKFPHL